MKNDKLNIDWEVLSSILDKSASSEERELFENWIGDEKNKLYFKEIKANWNASSDLSYCYDSETNEAWAKVVKKTITKPTKTRKLKIRIFQMAATILILFAIGTYLVFESKQELLSNNSVIQDYVLPDNSTVSLNKNSKLLFKDGFEGKKRELWLEGEAFFDVKRNPEKLFVVNVGKSIVKVLGTSFNIEENQEDQFIELTVKSGKVKFKVTDLNQSVIVEKGHAVRYDLRKKEIERMGRINANYLAWKTKILQFDQTPLREVALCLESVYDKKIIIKNKDLKELKFSASFNNQSLEKVLKVVALTFNIELKQMNQTIELHKQEE